MTTVLLQWLIFSVLSSSHPAVAASVAPLPPPPAVPTNPLPASQAPAPVDCAHLRERLKTYNDNARTNDQAVIGFLADTSTALRSWHNQLSPLEGTSNPITKGTFDVLSKGAQEVDEVSNMAFGNADYLAQDMAQIMTALDRCLPAQSAQTQK